MRDFLLRPEGKQFYPAVMQPSRCEKSTRPRRAVHSPAFSM